MNREIKFRCWHGASSRMLAHNEIDLEQRLKSPWAYQDDDESTLMLYTGLKDKNGKEIYEGDICRKLNTDWPSKPDSDPRTIQDYMNDIASVGVVVFEDCEFQLSVKSKKYYDECFYQSLRPGSHGFIEVIGNIYENPDLLK